MLFKLKNKKPNILMLSGGKDSSALLLMIKNGIIKITFKEIIFCDTGMEFPEMYDHLNKLEEYVNFPITRLKSPKTYNYYMFYHIKTKGKTKGKKGYGWKSGKVNWCTRVLKTSISDKYLKNKYYSGYNELIGIAVDEPKRLNNKWKNKIYPLVYNKITEGMCLKYCYEKGFDWGGLYTKFDRVSCWCCPNSNERELYMLYLFYPELWIKLKLMDKKAWNDFKYKRPVQYYDDKFKTYSNFI